MLREVVTVGPEIDAVARREAIDGLRSQGLQQVAKAGEHLLSDLLRRAGVFRLERRDWIGQQLAELCESESRARVRIAGRRIARRIARERHHFGVVS